jgi:hypothetical protein
MDLSCMLFQQNLLEMHLSVKSKLDLRPGGISFYSQNPVQDVVVVEGWHFISVHCVAAPVA